MNKAELPMRQQPGGKQTVLPERLRNSIIHIWEDVIGPWINEGNYVGQGLPQNANALWREISKRLSEDLGWGNENLFQGNARKRCEQFFLQALPEEGLRIIEVVFQYIDVNIRDLDAWAQECSGITRTPDEAITRLNELFRKYGIGYQFVDGKLLRDDSSFMMEAVTRPALSLLASEEFRGASEEFHRAYDHYRHGLHKEAITEACKAFESTMKIICGIRDWHVPSANAKDLIAAMFQHALIPAALESQFTSLRTLLESGLPTVRNKMAAHGQGVLPVEIPPYLVAYAIHLAAANIILLIEAHRENAAGSGYGAKP